MFKKNTAVSGFQIGHFIQTADGAAKTTGTPACKRLLDGTPGTLTNAAAYDATAGVWKIDLAAADVNGDMVGLSFTLADCLPIGYTLRTSTKLVSDLNDAAGGDTSGTTTLLTRVIGTLAAGTHNPQTGDAYARLGTPSGVSISADIADVPTNAELATALETADDAVIAAIAALNNLSSAQAQTAAAAALTAYDPPTNAELEARTLLAADYATATALTAVDAVTDKIDTALVLDGAVYQFTAHALELAPAGGGGGTGLTAQQIADAVNNLAPAGTAADGSIRDHLNDILEDTGITLPGLVSGLNGAVVEVVSAVSGGIITLYVADTWRFTVTSAALNLDGYEKLGLIVKANDRQSDDDALLYLRTDTNLVKVNGAAPVSAANGSLTKTTTSFSGLVAVAETQAVLSGDYRWWLKGLDTSPDPDEAITLAVGDFVLKSPGLRAVA